MYEEELRGFQNKYKSRVLFVQLNYTVLLKQKP